MWEGTARSSSSAWNCESVLDGGAELAIRRGRRDVVGVGDDELNVHRLDEVGGHDARRSENDLVDAGEREHTERALVQRADGLVLPTRGFTLYCSLPLTIRRWTTSCGCPRTKEMVRLLSRRKATAPP